MSSFFRAVFARHAITPLFQLFADKGVAVVYRFGAEEPIRLRAVIRAESTDFRDLEFGDILKPRFREIWISTNPGSPWGGVEDPQLGASFTFEEQDGTETEYSVDPTTGAGVRRLTTGLAIIGLRRNEAAAKVGPQLRRY